jgi:hypothetical protein
MNRNQRLIASAPPPSLREKTSINRVRRKGGFTSKFLRIPRTFYPRNGNGIYFQSASVSSYKCFLSGKRPGSCFKYYMQVNQRHLNDTTKAIQGSYMSSQWYYKSNSMVMQSIRPATKPVQLVDVVVYSPSR